MTDIPTLTPVQSSNIDAVGHDGAAGYIRFKTGATYRYPTLGAHHIEELRGALSIGGHFHKVIRPFHNGEKVS